MKKSICFVLAIIGAVLIIFAILKNSGKVEAENSFDEYTPEQEISDEQNRMTIVTLYFLNPNTGELVPEARSVDVKDLMDDPYTKILDLLIEGSEDSKIGKTIPDGTCVNSIRLDGEELTIDFDEFFTSQYEMGSDQQVKMVYSIVNTFLELKEVTSVRFLVNGETIEGMENSFERLV